MRIEKITIKNFKGIKHVELNFTPTGSNVFTLIGLNESGKTTILEAISTFKIGKDETSALYETTLNNVEPATYVPKRYKSNFTGDITVTVEVAFEKGEKEDMIIKMEKLTGHKIVLDSIADKIQIVRGYRFDNSDFKELIYTMDVFAKTKEKGKKKLIRIFDIKDLWNNSVEYIIKKIPEIIYFPTFIFNQPEKIILNPSTEEKPVNRLYRQIIDNIASSLERPLDVQRHIVDRILAEGSTTEKVLSFFMLAPDKQQQIEAALNEMSSHVTQTVFKSWTKIFGGDFSGREIVLKPGVQTINNKQEVYIQFAIKDRISTYDITERSLGFRWFFSFLLFTFYRSSNSGRPTFFLLDEPASNLHARAQMQLLDNLSKIAINGSLILYSTHSHYLINPEWLDQAYIISNTAIDYDHLDGSNDSSFDGQTDVKADRYRNFIGQNPSKMTYFQPVLDKLDVIPSRLDLTRKSVLVEGKGDYLILEYGRRVILKSESDVCIVPTRGATGMDELIGLFMGWGVPFIICLDDDKEGRMAQKKYLDDWGFTNEKVITLKNIHEDLTDKEISGFLDNSDLELIKIHFGLSKEPTKSQIHLFFSENLATKSVLKMSDKYIEKMKSYENFITKSFDGI